MIFFVLIAIAVILLSLFMIKGFRIKLEQQSIGHTMDSIVLGTTIMNHTVKNELQKVEYICRRIQDMTKQNRNEKALEWIDDLNQVTNHLKDMALRMNNRVKDFHLDLQEEKISSIVLSAATVIHPYAEAKQIHCKVVIKKDQSLMCDRVHLREVIVNICLNAIDAMQTGKGELELILTQKRSKLILLIKDNGKGIEGKYWDKIFEPFFSTKKNPNHYGLGLSYCYMVALKHGFDLKIIDSELNTGTTFGLIFPILNGKKKKSA